MMRPVVTVILLSSLVLTVSAISCRQCQHMILKNHEDLQEAWQVVMEESGSWDPNCQRGGNQGDSIECTVDETHCVSVSMRLRAEMLDTKLDVQAYQRFCASDEDDQLGDLCVDDISEYEDEIMAEVDEDDRDIFKDLAGSLCACSASDNCNSEALEEASSGAEGKTMLVGLVLGLTLCVLF